MPARPLLQLWFAGRAVRHGAGRTRSAGTPLVEVPGPAPLRVLLTGAGLATGYGVTTYDAGIAGPLAHRLADGTGRGVVVEVRAAPMLPCRLVVRFLGRTGAAGFDAAVFAPCYLEAPAAPNQGVRRFAAAIQRHLLDTGGPGLRLAMVGVPRPARFSRLDLAAAQAATDANLALRRLADLERRVAYVEPDEFSSVLADEPFDEAYYARAGAGIAAALLPMLGDRDRLDRAS